MFELTLDIFFCDVFAYIEASLTGSCVTLFTDVTARFLILFVFIKSLGCTDGHITILQGYLDLIFCKSRQIHFQLITAFGFLDISLHQVFTSAAVQLLFYIAFCVIIEKWKILHKVIK